MKGMWCNSITACFTLDWYGSLKPNIAKSREETTYAFMGFAVICALLNGQFGVWFMDIVARNNRVYWSCRIHSVWTVYLWLPSLHSTLFLLVETSTSCCKVVTGASSFKVSSFCSFPHNFKGFICTSAPWVTSQRGHFHYLLCHCHLSSGELHRATGTSQLWLAVSNCTIICTYSASSHCLLLSISERD